MRKLTFERAILMVFILIILISTSDTTGRYIKKIVKSYNKPNTSVESRPNSGFATVLMNADNLFREGDYAGAAKEYLAMTLNMTSITQKIHAYFRLGVCQYKLGNYDLAEESFIKASSLDPDDDVALNNAAVSAYMAKDMQKAIELQAKALEIYPAIEYYYNLARMYEDLGEYDLAANNFQVVAEVEQNISRLESIDPVRVKEKAARLKPHMQDSAGEAVSNALKVYKLNDSRDVFLINDNEMQLKESDFIVKVENQKNTKSIVASYDRTKNDPYNLITDIFWTIYKDGKKLYEKRSDKINVDATTGGNYEIKLSIRYNGNKESLSSKTVSIRENQSTIGNETQNEVVVSPSKGDSKHYADSIYEQLFESDFKISRTGYTDKNNVVWGKDRGVEVSHNDKLSVDRSGSLIVVNDSDKDAGLWINLDTLLKNENIKGKTIRISFFARKITDNAKIFVNTSIKINNIITTTKKSFNVPYKFEQQVISVYIPEEASGLTISIKTIANEQFNIDGFAIYY